MLRSQTESARGGAGAGARGVFAVAMDEDQRILGMGAVTGAQGYVTWIVGGGGMDVEDDLQAAILRYLDAWLKP